MSYTRLTLWNSHLDVKTVSVNILQVIDQSKITRVDEVTTNPAVVYGPIRQHKCRLVRFENYWKAKNVMKQSQSLSVDLTKKKKIIKLRT